MQWTYATVDAFFHDQKALDPTLQRLLANQDDIGNAIAALLSDDAGWISGQRIEVSGGMCL